MLLLYPFEGDEDIVRIKTSMSNRTFMMRRGQRSLRYFFSLALAVSTLSAVSVSTAPNAHAVAGPIYDFQGANYDATNGQWTNSGSIGGSVTRSVSTGSTNPVKGTSPASVMFTGSTNGYQFVTTTQYANPQSFSFNVWFKTSTAGGKLVGFESSSSAACSGSFDRMLYIGTDGKLYFQTTTGVAPIVSASAVTDGNWQNAVAVLTNTTMTLYLNGIQIGDPVTTNAGAYDGYWRIGGCSGTGWFTNFGTSGYFNGEMAQVSIYDRGLSSSEVTTAYSNTKSTYGHVPCGTSGFFWVNGTTVTKQSSCTGSVTIPEGVTTVNGSAFYGVSGVTSVSLPSTLLTIGSSAFRTTRISTVVIPASVTSIGELAFSINAVNVTSVTFSSPSSLTTLGNYAFQYSDFASITIPASVTNMGTDVFNANDVLTSIYFLGNKPGGSTSDIYRKASITVFKTSNATGFSSTWLGANVVSTSNDANLSGLSISSGSLSPTFATSTTSYTASVLNETNTVTVTPTQAQANATIQVRVNSGSYASVTSSTASGSLSLNVGSNTIDVLVTAQDGTTTATYAVTVTRAAPPATAAAITTQPIGSASGSALGTQPVIRIVDSAGGTVASSTVNVVASIASGTGTLSGTMTVAAVAGVATFTNLVITGTPGSFTLTFTPISLTAVTSNSLTITANAALTPTFGTPTTTANGFTVQISNYDAAYTWAGTATASGSVSISDSGLITVTGVAPSTSSTATITTTRTGYTSGSATVSGTSASNISTLSGLTLSAGTLSPTFASSTTSYTATVLSDTSTVTVTPTRSQANATITVNGTTVSSGSASGSISLNVGANTITVIGTAQDGSTTTYTITVTRAGGTPAITIGTTNFMPRVVTNVGVVLTGFDETLSYQATVKFVNATTNADVSNGTLAAARGSTSLISGYTSYSSAKLGFKGTYAQIAAALASMTWNPATAAADIRMRIGISTVPGTNEFYDANSGRYYRFVPAATTWTQARTNAEATTLFGLRGYLAEITSAAENAFIANETSAFNIWIGATEDSVTAVGTDGKGGWTGTSYNGSAGQRWIWNGAVETPLPVGTGAIAQGPATAFSGWRNVGTIEPNNDAKPGADCGLTNWGARGVWNDRPCSVSYSSLIEFGGRPGETSTAIGATLTSTVSAGAAVLYTITYNPNSGNTTPTQASLTTGQTFNLANAITRNASGDTTYEFAGWRSGSVIYKAGDPITVGTANLAYTAVWVQLYEVTYVVNGGTFSGSETVNDSECNVSTKRCSDAQSITLNAAPTRAGYTFDGWKDQSGAAVIDANSGVAEVQTVVTSTNYIFTATWTPITYTITYVSSGSTAPTQGALREGLSFTVAAAATKAGFEFTGWNDGTFTFLPDSDFTVQTSNITLTAQWSALYTVTYSQGLGSGTPATGPTSYSEGSEIIIDTDSGISRSGFTFAGWNDGTTTFQPGASYTVGTSNVTLTAQWTAIPAAPAPVVVPTPVVPVGPPPSVLKTITNPKISRDDKGYYCQVGKYVFLREGRTEETPKLTTQVFSLLSNGVVIDSIKSALDKVLFAKSDTYLESTLTCQVDVGQENLVTTSYSLNAADISAFAATRKSAIEAADVKYYKDREDAYAKKDKEFVRLAAVKAAAVAASKSSKEIFTASANYQKAYAAASELWKKELADASTNRVLARDLAQKAYLEALESAGISIYPTPVKAAVTPTPTPTPTPKPTPTPTPTPVVTNNPRPTAQMVKVGTVYMATGSYSLNDATKITLKAIALKINASDAESILVYGHTDSRGGVNNTVLSQNRAKAVANYLRPLLKGKKITVGWYASRKPVAGGNSAADLAKNRRVEIYTK